MLKSAAALTTVTALLSLAATPSFAKDCKQVLVQAGEPSLTRLVAYPSSLFSWRKAARDKYGEGYESWRHAADRKIDCKPSGTGTARWVCTRTAQPCSDGAAKTITADRLQNGDKGDQVIALQQVLNDHGYTIKVDGSFGDATERAVRDFQKKNGLSADGVVGKATKEALLS